MSDKDFKVKNKLIVNGLDNASGVILSTNNQLDSHNLLPTQYGGTGTTTSPSSGQILYSASGATYTPTTLSSLVPPAVTNTAISTNTTLSAGIRYFVDTSAARTLTLPASPTQGDEIQIIDTSGTAATNKITVNRNSGKINGIADNLSIDVNGAAATLIYTGSSWGWVVR